MGPAAPQRVRDFLVDRDGGEVLPTVTANGSVRYLASLVSAMESEDGDDADGVGDDDPASFLLQVSAAGCSSSPAATG
eukprot:2540504-Pyramimonas_sp.AAC.1